MASDPPGFTQYTAKQLTDKEPVLHDKMQNGLASEVLAKYDNHAIQTVHREASGQAEYHENQIDVIMVRKGEGQIVIGGKVVDGKTTAPGEIRGAKIEGGETHELKAGDVLHIPVKTPHQVLLKKGQKVDYIAIKIDAPPVK
jgi:mannose-6-phosphate isomerase-like protein (cupin superfamily)